MSIATTIEPQIVNISVQHLPSNMRAKGVMSTTSVAIECFADQRFSAQLQAFVISYANSISSERAVYGV